MAVVRDLRRTDLKRPSIEAALSAAMTSMASPSSRSSAAVDVAGALALALARELGWPGATTAAGVAAWTVAFLALGARALGGWDRYASRMHAMVDANALFAAAAEVTTRAAGRAPGVLAESVVRLALLVRACATSALWANNGYGFFVSSAFGAKGSPRGVFHRLEHAGALNIAVCVSVAAIALGPKSGAQHRIGVKLVERALGVRVDDGALDVIERVEQVLAAVLTTMLFNYLLNSTRRRLLGRPLQGIIETLEHHAKQVFKDLEVQQSEMQSLDISVLGYVLEKMSHIVKRSESDSGSSALIEAILEDHEDVDGQTREWLVSYDAKKVNSMSAKSASKSHVSTFKSVISSFARMSDSGEPYMRVNIDELNSWSFDVFAVSDMDVIPSIVRMFYELGLLDLVDLFKLRRFLSEVQSAYRDNPYHCFKHAFDVTHTTYLYVLSVRKQVNLSQIEMFCLLVAALVHDMDHPGVTNAYLIATRDSTALTYNDESVLENHHISRFFTLCHNNEDANILSAFDDGTYKEIRRTIIGCVLHTDMAHHFKLVSRMNEIVTLGRKNDIINGSPIKSCVIDPSNNDVVNSTFKSEEQRQLMLSILLHCADISNAVKPKHLCVKWASRVLEEFFNQGDRERAKGMAISPMMDRESTSIGLSQINFIEFVIAPLFVQFAAIFPTMTELLGRLVENRLHYQEAYEFELDEATKLDGIDRSSEKDSLRTRFCNLIEKHSLHAHARKLDDELMRAVLALQVTSRRGSGKSTPISSPLASPVKSRP